MKKGRYKSSGYTTKRGDWNKRLKEYLIDNINLKNSDVQNKIRYLDENGNDIKYEDDKNYALRMQIVLKFIRKKMIL